MRCAVEMSSHAAIAVLRAKRPGTCQHWHKHNDAGRRPL
ncbi:hypothetical protein XHC_3513 [Xanthomonas hortorum pv. carotae str. M081]|nr:hypothetical protein XHC_3513 [Xanthomonas hortorum pv. carotae str. M081]